MLSYLLFQMIRMIRKGPIKMGLPQLLRIMYLFYISPNFIRGTEAFSMHIGTYIFKNSTFYINKNIKWYLIVYSCFTTVDDPVGNDHDASVESLEGLWLHTSSISGLTTTITCQRLDKATLTCRNDNNHRINMIVLNNIVSADLGFADFKVNGTISDFKERPNIQWNDGNVWHKKGRFMKSLRFPHTSFFPTPGKVHAFLNVVQVVNQYFCNFLSC